MIRMLFCLHRLPGLSPEEFHTYWRDVHGPLVAQHAPAIRLALYRQHHRASDPLLAALLKGRAIDLAFDGIAEAGWHSEADLIAGGGTPENRAVNRALVEDEARFIDLPRSPIFFYRTIDVIG